MPLKKTKTPKFSPEVYKKITLNDLVLFTLYYMQGQGSEITSEDIISTCFIMFPKRFSLRKYPHWPDSAVVSRRWSDCKSKGYILGNTAKGFRLTAKGLRRARKVEKMLVGTRPLPARAMPTEIKTRAGRFVRSIETSDAFAHYKKNGRESRMSEFDFRSLLLCTMESPPATLARNLEQFKEYARMHERKDLLTFLDYCEDKFSRLLGAPKKARQRKMWGLTR
jgi:hypothetical protein